MYNNLFFHQTKHRVCHLEMAHRMFPSFAKTRPTFPHCTQQNRDAIPTIYIILTYIESDTFRELILYIASSLEIYLIKSDNIIRR
jgi:hypothetical protein